MNLPPPPHSSLEIFVRSFALAMIAVDARKPIATSLRTAATYQPGIGPHSESKTIELVSAELKATGTFPEFNLAVPYPSTPRQRCDLVVPDDAGGWHLE